jgi:hypothetical protein
VKSKTTLSKLGPRIFHLFLPSTLPKHVGSASPSPQLISPVCLGISGHSVSLRLQAADRHHHNVDSRQDSRQDRSSRLRDREPGSLASAQRVPSIINPTENPERRHQDQALPSAQTAAKTTAISICPRAPGTATAAPITCVRCITDFSKQ